MPTTRRRPAAWAGCGGPGWSAFAKVVQSYRHWSRWPLLPAESREALFTLGRGRWRQEVDLYLSDLGDRLPAGLRLPVVHGVVDLGDERLLLVLEDVDVDHSPWDAVRFARAARLLGRLHVRMTEAAVLPGDERRPSELLHAIATSRLGPVALPPLAADATWRHPLLTAERHLRDDLDARLRCVVVRGSVGSNHAWRGVHRHGHPRRLVPLGRPDRRAHAGVTLVDAVDGVIERLTIWGVDVAPLVEAATGDTPNGRACAPPSPLTCERDGQGWRRCGNDRRAAVAGTPVGTHRVSSMVSGPRETPCAIGVVTMPGSARHHSAGHTRTIGRSAVQRSSEPGGGTGARRRGQALPTMRSSRRVPERMAMVRDGTSRRATPDDLAGEGAAAGRGAEADRARCLGDDPRRGAASPPLCRPRSSDRRHARHSVPLEGNIRARRRELRMSRPEEASLRSQMMATITAAARIMYPHDALPDEVYAQSRKDDRGGRGKP